MSSWLLSFSLPNPFKSDSDDEDAAGDDQDSRNNDEPSSTDHHSYNSTSSIASGVKQDLSALSQTFSHQLRGVAAFLAPPAPSPPQPLTGDNSSSTTTSSAPLSNEAFTGIRRDLEEIGGSFKSLFSSSSTGISKFASSLLQFQEDGDAIRDGGDEDDDLEEEEESYEDIPGINEEVVDFVRKVSLRPELWTDFPLSLPIDFDMSDNQIEHAASMEELVPNLPTLRQQTCSNMSGGQFWTIYFVLLLPRLNETDMELLSTSEIIEVRETLLKKLQSKSDVKDENSGIPETGNVSAAADVQNVSPGHGSLSEQKVLSAESSSIARDGEVEIGREKLEGVLEHEDAGQDESLHGQKYTEDLGDVSFSDLEDDGNDLSDRVSGMRPTQSGRGSSASESNEWVRLTENSGAQGGQNKRGLLNRRGKDSEGDESSDWLTVDDSDTDTLAGAV